MSDCRRPERHNIATTATIASIGAATWLMQGASRNVPARTLAYWQSRTSSTYQHFVPLLSLADCTTGPAAGEMP